MCICIYIYIDTHTHTHIYTYTYIHIHTRTYIYTHVYLIRCFTKSRDLYKDGKLHYFLHESMIMYDYVVVTEQHPCRPHESSRTA